MDRYFFSGIAGAGMNPLAQLMRAWGHEVAGSDRGFDQGQNLELKARLEAQGMSILPQDGSGVVAGIDRMVFSTAVEMDTPELHAAKRLEIPIQSRPQLLAEVVNRSQPGVAIAGTSGKSTVTGMVAWILRCSQRVATVLGGAALAGEGVAGGFAVGPEGGLLVAEACESDGTLIGYRPTIGLLHNITRDHAELESLRRQFATFAGQCGTLFVNRGCAEAARVAEGHPRVVGYSAHGPADAPLEVIAVGPHRARGVLSLPDGSELLIDLPQPGAHNLENAAAATLIARELGVAHADIGTALASFPGVARRFEVVGTTENNIRVVDDYAHNADKIRAAVTAAQAGCDRLVAVFKPHGYGPARFLRPELKELLPTLLRPHDRFCYAEIFYAGGTVLKDISSKDLAEDLPAAMRCGFAPGSAEVLSWVAETAIPGDTVLVMGARDPDLPKLARAIYGLL